MDTIKQKNKSILYHSMVLGIFCIIVFSLYANTLEYPFIFDDVQNIANNYLIKIDSLSIEGFGHIVTLSPNKWRIFPNISFALNYYFGGSSVWGYHLVNIIIHSAAAFVFYLLAKTTIALPGLKNRIKRVNEIAFAAALLWAAHPLQTNGVTYIVQRMTSMATLFFLLALLCYVKARITADGSRKIILFSSAILFAVMALFSKENSAMLPAMALGYELFFLARPGQEETNRKKLLVMGGAALVIFLLICWIFLGNDPLARVLSGYGGREFTLGQRLLTETRIVIHYLSLLVLPLPSRMNLAYDYQLSTGLFSPPETLLAIAGLTCLASFALLLYRKDRLTSFAVFWLLGNLVVESTIIPLELIFEHRMYLPSMFIILAGVAWIYSLPLNRGKTARMITVGGLLLLALLTWQRNSAWKDPITLWTDVIQKSPGSVRGHGNLGLAYINAKKYDTAKYYLEKAISIGHNDKSSNFNFAARTNYIAIAHDNLALAHRETGNFPDSVLHAEKALELDPKRPNSLITLGITYSKTGHDQKAYDMFSKAAKEGIISVDLYNNWAVSSYNLNKVDYAILLLKKAIELQPDHAESHYNLGIAFSSKGMIKEAREEMELAMKFREKNK